MPSVHTDDNKNPGSPAFCKLICLAALTFHGVIFLLLLTGLANSEWLANMLLYYYPGLTTTGLILIDLAGISLLSVIILGLVLVNRRQKAGIYLYIIGTLSLILTIIIWIEPDLLFIATEIIFLLILAACHFRRNKIRNHSKFNMETQ